eukprot:Skav218640  [mRNA]  locus=scaffold365:335632:343880:- [translate_table: standard]
MRSSWLLRALCLVFGLLNFLSPTTVQRATVVSATMLGGAAPALAQQSLEESNIYGGLFTAIAELRAWLGHRKWTQELAMDLKMHLEIVAPFVKMAKRNGVCNCQLEGTAATRQGSADERIRMECDKAHCLKCQAVLRTRGSVHEAKREIFGAEANGEGRRVSGEASTFKQAPGSAMESTSGTCSKSPNGMHHWKYGKCNYCQMAEGKLAKGPGVLPNPGGAADCEMGGKCMFKFAKCTKCGRGESGMKGGDSRRPSDVSTASSSLADGPRSAASKSPAVRPSSPPLAAAAGLLVKDSKSDEDMSALISEPSPSKGETRKTSKGTGDDRSRVTCHVCGYKSVPQWLNDRAHCLKCDAVLKTLGLVSVMLTRASIHGTVDLPDNIQQDLSASRAPGEASTYKQAPGSAMESTSGTCSKSPNGMHHWKYGKCNYCQMAEGKFVKGAGALANPGGAATCTKDGGKCMCGLDVSIVVDFLETCLSHGMGKEAELEDLIQKVRSYDTSEPGMFAAMSTTSGKFQVDVPEDFDKNV